MIDQLGLENSMRWWAKERETYQGWFGVRRDEGRRRD